MQFRDFSPPMHPSREQQSDALQKGLGRTFHWAETRQLQLNALMDACLNDHRYDRQCEDNRGEWLWKIACVAGMTSQVRDPLFQKLRTVTEGWEASQLCELALHFALAGDDGFRRQLYEFVGQRQIQDHPEMGEWQLLSLAGLDGLTFLARLRGEHLSSHAWEWHDSAVVKYAIEMLGEVPVLDLLKNSTDTNVRRFYACWLADSERRDHSEMRSVKGDQRLTVTDVLKAAHGDGRPFQLRFWANCAETHELESIIEAIFTEPEAAVVAKLLLVFSGQPMPRFDARMIALCGHTNPDVRRRAFNALSQNSNPLVREFALEELIKPKSDGLAVGLFINNFEKGDEQWILEHVEIPDDPHQRHGVLMDVTRVLEENVDAHCLELGLISYFETPCQICRHSAAQLLVDAEVAPCWLIDECRHDANEDCHQLDVPDDHLQV
ncbi:hypothetical protein [Schlesneria sp. T3-172]|uniref:hypothetical protein n=1 Tax=Schlesneria sphaerica TaxID=3373610 RepID=UPI0037CA0699